MPYLQPAGRSSQGEDVIVAWDSHAAADTLYSESIIVGLRLLGVGGMRGFMEGPVVAKL